MCALKYVGIACLFSNSKPTKVAAQYTKCGIQRAAAAAVATAMILWRKIIYDEAVMRASARARARNLSVELCGAFARTLALGRIDFTLALNFATIRPFPRFHFAFRMRER